MRKLKPAHFLAYVDYWLGAAFPALRCLWVLMTATSRAGTRTPPTMAWYVREMDRTAQAGTAEDASVRIVDQHEPGMLWTGSRARARTGLRGSWRRRGSGSRRGSFCKDRKTIVRRDSTRLVSSIITRSPSHNNVNCTSVPCT
ncbi:hypothetical protein B0H14DRAFT_2900528 [Mycena olivaceomarginata]|nr:hypothetical protein B0H14DRAFT_2900528 [Mycena olivaceomarginata]